MMDNRLDFGKVTAWLNDNGGYCDCKVMDRSPRNGERNSAMIDCD